MSLIVVLSTFVYISKASIYVFLYILCIYLLLLLLLLLLIIVIIVIIIIIIIIIESKFNKSHEFKATSYNNLRNALITPRAQFNLILVEISTLNFAGKMIKTYSKCLKELKRGDERIINKCQEVAIRTSYYIYCRRRKEWTDPELMSYT